jgi:hypothetical protein
MVGGTGECPEVIRCGQSFISPHELRARWRGWAALVLLMAIAGGAVLAAAAGARRTATAYPRFLTASNASDLLVAPVGSGLGGYFVALARLPRAGAVALMAVLNLEPLRPRHLGPAQSGHRSTG